MSLRHLEALFKPSAIAVVGATNRPFSAGRVIMRNLLEGGFSGPIMPVNPKHDSVAGVLAYPDVASLPRVPDLGVVVTPPAVVPEAVEALGRKGAKAAIVVTTDLDITLMPDGRTVEDAMLANAKRYGTRVLGGGTIGLLAPKLGLDASLTHIKALPGQMAFISQSGALATMVLDWARPRRIGFSHMVALGDGADIDFGDLLDYLGTDSSTRAILLYIEDMERLGSFMAAARAAARNKPVLAIKVGRNAPALESADLHFGALVGPDDVFSAALQRAGILEVGHIDELFGAVETLARSRMLRGESLAVLTNGGGTHAMAADELGAHGLPLPPLPDEVLRKLDAAMPKGWSRTNPVEIRVNAPPARYAEALKILVESRAFDAVLVMHAPTALSQSDEIAKSVIEIVKKHGGNVTTCWAGGETVDSARRMFVEAGLATYETPRSAIRAFLHLARHRRNQETLMQTPPSVPVDFRPDIAAARAIVARALAAGRAVLNEPETKAVLAAFGMNVTPTHIAADPQAAAEIADKIGYPIALTILSPDIARKWDVGGVALTLENRDAVKGAAEAMMARLHDRLPGARLNGFTVQRMVPRRNARQLIIGVASDPLFGPVILFGEGGRAIEVIRDHAVALPPLNMHLARELISRTRVASLLGAYHDRPPADLDAISLALMQVSQMVIDLPELVELSVNPLFADDRGVVVVDAVMRIAPPIASARRLAIRPYPKELEEETRLRDGRKILLRPIRPEDEPAHQVMLSKMEPEDIRLRFFHALTGLEHSEMARLTQIDYEREMAFIATLFNDQGEAETLGVARTVTDPDNEKAEFAVALRSDLKGQGLGRILMEKIIRHTKARRTPKLVGEVLGENRSMLGLAKKLGFTVAASNEDGVVTVTLDCAAP